MVAASTAPYGAGMAIAEQFRSAAREMDGHVEAIGKMGRALEQFRQDPGVAGQGRVAQVIGDAMLANAGTLSMLITECGTAAETLRQRARVCDAYDEEYETWLRRHREWQLWAPSDDDDPSVWAKRPARPQMPEPPARWVTATATLAVAW